MIDEKTIRRALMTAKNLAIAVDPGFSRIKLPEIGSEAPLHRASGGEVEPFHAVGSPERDENLEKFLEGNHPLVPRELLMGTLGDWDEFHFGMTTPTANVGPGAYASNSPEDVAENYAGIGPDMRHKMTSWLERNNYGSLRELENAERDPGGPWERSWISDTGEKPEDVRRKLNEAFKVAHSGATYKVHLSLKNPVVLAKDSKHPWYETRWSEEHEHGHPRGLTTMMDAVGKAAERYGVDEDYKGELLKEIQEHASDHGKIGAYDLHKIIMDSSAGSEEDEDGLTVGSRIFKTAMQGLGHDGVIDATVHKKFGPQRFIFGETPGMKGITPDTIHYVVWKHDQLKSAIGNRGTYARGERKITKSEGGDVERIAKASGGEVEDRDLEDNNWGRYSKAAEAAANLKQASGTPEQMIAAVRNNPGVKPEELEWANLDNAFAGKSRITKDELADHFHDSIPPIGVSQYERHSQHVIPGGDNYRAVALSLDPAFVNQENPAYDDMRKNPYTHEAHYEDPNVVASYRAVDRIDKSTVKGNDASLWRKMKKQKLPIKTRWDEDADGQKVDASEVAPGLFLHRSVDPFDKGKWTLTHGGTGLSLHSKFESIPHAMDGLKLAQDAYDGWKTASRSDVRRWAADFSGGKELYRKLRDLQPDASNKIFHIEEIQSDWGQKGREEGFREPTKDSSDSEKQKDSLAFKNRLIANGKPILERYKTYLSKQFEDTHPNFASEEPETRGRLKEAWMRDAMNTSLTEGRNPYFTPILFANMLTDLRSMDPERTYRGGIDLHRYQVIANAMLDKMGDPSVGKRGFDDANDWITNEDFRNDPWQRAMYHRMGRLRRPEANRFRSMVAYQNHDPSQLSPDVFRVVADELRHQYGGGGEQEVKDLDGLPKGPHVGTTQGWTDIALKHALREAAKNGYGSMMITPGYIHADRWGKLQKADMLTLRKNQGEDPVDGEYTLTAFQGGNRVARADGSRKDMEKMVDRNTIAKLLGEVPPEKHENYDDRPIGPGENPLYTLTTKKAPFKVGGQGYKTFYDEIVPKRLLALAREHDPEAKLEVLGQGLGTKGSKEVARSLRKSEWEMPSGFIGIRITPKMREGILKRGYAAYASGGAVPGPEESRDLGYSGIYSHAAEMAEQMKQAEGPRDQMIATLKNMPGVKDEELRWSRLGELPERVTRQDLANQLREYMPRLNVFNLRKSRDADEDEDEDPYGDYVHYEDYAYPGGTNYREKLITLNQPIAYEKYGVMTPYEPSHFGGENNLVAHVMLTDRIGRAAHYLHIDELQSDWAQEGRKQGFVDNRPYAAKQNRLERELKKDMEGKYREAYKNYLSGVTEGDNLALGNRGAHVGGQWEPSGPLTRNPIMDLWDITETNPNHPAKTEIKKDPEFAEALRIFQRDKPIPFRDLGLLYEKAKKKGKPIGPRRTPFELFDHVGFDELRDHFRNNPNLADKLASIFVNKRATVGELADKNPDQSFYRLLQENRDESDRANRNKRPSFPYVESTQSWVDRALKSVFFQEVGKGGGYDYVTWNPGRIVADKYGLSDKISHLDFSQHPQTKNWSLSGYKVPDFDEIEAAEMSDEEFISASEEAGQKFEHNAVPDDKLEAYVGGEVARKMRQTVADNPTKAQHRFMKEALEVPHKGMHDFYDNILPKRALAIAREHDPEAKIVIVPATPDHPKSIHGFMAIKITPKMRESMLRKGFKAYRRGGIVKPVETNVPVLDRDKAIRRALMIAKAEGGPIEGPQQGGLSFPPEEAAFRLRTKLNREAAVAAGKKVDPGLPVNERMVIRAPRAKKGERQLPNFVTGNIDFKDWIGRHEKLMTPEEAHAFSKWYKEIHGEFMKYTNNNAHDASVLMRAWLVAQQNIAPAPAMSNVLLQREQIGRGVPEGEMVAGGMPNPTQAARAVLRNEPITAGVGRKIADFVDSAEGRNVRAYLGNDPRGGEPFVVDIHTARDAGLVDPALLNHLRNIGYNEDDIAKVQHDFDASPSDAQYENRAQWGRNLTKHLNKIGWLGKKDWRPEEVQAVGWMGMTKLTRDAAETSVTGLAKNLRRVSFELSPGEGSPWAEKYGEAFNGLPDQDKYAITDHLTKRAFDLGNQLAQTYLVNLVSGTGAWEKYQNPSTVAQVLASAHGSETLANIIGHLLHQTEVWSNNVKPVTASPKGFAIDFMENGSRNLADRDELQNFWQRVMDADDTHKDPDKKLIKGYQPITSPDGQVGVRVLIDKGGAATGKRLFETLNPGGSIDTMLKSLPYDITSHLAEAEITKARNDWRTDNNGQAYLQRLRALTGRDLEPQLRNHGSQLAQELEGHLDRAYQGQGRTWRTAPKGQAQGQIAPPALATGGSVDRALQVAMRARQGFRR